VVERGGERDPEQARDEQGGGPAVDPRERAHGRDDQHPEGDDYPERKAETFERDKRRRPREIERELEGEQADRDADGGAVDPPVAGRDTPRRRRR
jgi:hypothetical protein